MFGLNPYVIIGTLLAFLAASGAAYVKGYHDADKSSQVSTLNREVADLQARLLMERAQARALQDVADRASEKARAAEQVAADKDAEIDDYVRRLEQPRPGCDCSLSADDVERLRHIYTPRASPPNTPSRPLDLRRAGSGARSAEGR